MMKKAMVLCNSAFQLITAVRVCEKILEGYVVDLVISDLLANADDIRQKIENTHFFNAVYVFKSKGYDWKNWKFTLLGERYEKELFDRAAFLKGNSYDIFFFGNIGSGTAASCLATYVRNRDNTELCMFEDGFASYSRAYRNSFEDVYNAKGLKHKLLYGKEKPGFYYITRYYVYYPELLEEWDYPFEIKRIPTLDEHSKQILNAIFEFDKCADAYHEKYIFFEESYFADGTNIGDIDIVDSIADIVGKENMLVKIHPRNPVNRFAEKGYKTNKDTSIPWEVIALNIDLSQKVLITIASGSSITSYFVSGQRAEKSLLLYDMECFDKSKLTPSIPIFDRMCKNNDYFKYPSNMEGLRKLLSEEN